MAFAHFDIDLDRTGRYSTVKMDGVDITNAIKSIRVECSVSEVTKVSIDFLGTVSGSIEGELGGTMIDLKNPKQTWRIVELVE